MSEQWLLLVLVVSTIRYTQRFFYYFRVPILSWLRIFKFQVSKQRKQEIQKIVKMIWQKCKEIMSRANLEDKNSTRKVKCDVCNQTLTPELTLSEHKIMRHPMAGNVRVMRPTILQRSRLDTNNTNGRNHLNYQCIRCSYASNNSSNLGRHLEVNRNLGFTIYYIRYY